MKIIKEELDEEYRTTVINFNKYKNVTYGMSKIMELSKQEQNQIIFYLYNSRAIGTRRVERCQAKESEGRKKTIKMNEAKLQLCDFVFVLVYF